MDKKSEDLSVEKAKKLAGSAAGQQLLQALRQSNAQAFSQAGAALQSGNYADAQKALQQLVQDPAVSELLKKLED